MNEDYIKRRTHLCMKYIDELNSSGIDGSLASRYNEINQSDDCPAIKQIHIELATYAWEKRIEEKRDIFLRITKNGPTRMNFAGLAFEVSLINDKLVAKYIGD